MQLSVIILNYKVPYFLMLCLESVTKSLKGLEAEVIVVDNHSQDESCGLVRAHFPAVKLISNTTNVGFSKGNNIGIQKAKGELICLLNPDTVVGEHTFKNLIAFSQQHPDFGGIGPKLIDGSGRFLPESKRNLPTPQISLKKLFNAPKDYYAALHKNKNGKVAILVGAFMLMRKDRYLEVGGLDEDYFMYGEDIDLSYKFKKHGYQNYYVGQESVLHFKGESTANNAAYRQHFYEAMTLFYKKHFRKNALSQKFVNLGAQLAKAGHPLRQKKAVPSSQPKKYLWIGKHQKIVEALEQKLNTTISIFPLSEDIASIPAHTTLIFDAGQFNFEFILQQIEKQGHSKYYFRFKPAQFNFIIGSDKRTEKGEVILASF